MTISDNAVCDDDIQVARNCREHMYNTILKFRISVTSSYGAAAGLITRIQHSSLTFLAGLNPEPLLVTGIGDIFIFHLV